MVNPLQLTSNNARQSRFMAENESESPWGVELKKARGQIEKLLMLSREDSLLVPGHSRGIFSDDKDDERFWLNLEIFIGARKVLKKYLSALDEASLTDLHVEAESLYFDQGVGWRSDEDETSRGWPLISLGELDNLEWIGGFSASSLRVPGIREIQDREKLISILTTASNEWGKERIEATIQAAVEKRDSPVPDWLQSLL